MLTCQILKVLPIFRTRAFLQDLLIEAAGLDKKGEQRMTHPAENTSKSQKSAMARFIVWFSQWSFRWVPDAMVFVLALTLVVYLMAWALTSHGPVQLIHDWVKGFWILLTFGMQMSVLMITGFTVADSRYVRKGITWLVSLPKTRFSTVLMYTWVLGILWWLHWGIGMMTSIIMGRELAVAKRGLKIHYPFIAAISYCAIICTNGPSMAAQLLIATPGHFMEKVTGVIPISATTFDPYLLLTNFLLFLGLPVILFMVMPDEEDSVEISDQMVNEILASSKVEVISDPKSLTPAQRWDRSPVLPIIVGVAGLYWIGDFLITKGVGKMDLNTLNFVFMILGIVLHGSANSFMSSVQRGVGTVGGVIVQFPLYAGIFGIIMHSGLAHVIANWFVAISTAHNFPWVVFIYSSIMNIFVPSGGSKFVIEAPYIMPAAKQLGANVPWVINAYTFGDELTNLIQPFWALPILGAYKLKFQDILPYGVIVMVFMFILVTISLLYFPLWF